MCLLPTDYAKNETTLNFDLEDINIATICKTLDGDCLHLLKHPIIEGKNKSIIGLVLLLKNHYRLPRLWAVSQLVEMLVCIMSKERVLSQLFVLN